MDKLKKYLPGIILATAVAISATLLNDFIPKDILGATLLALIIGMLLNPVVEKFGFFNDGINWVSRFILKLGIILMGINLSFLQVLQAGKYGLLLMAFTLTTSFAVAQVCGKIFKINWKLTNLLAVSTAICGGTAVATLGPTIEAEERDIAYAISATFLFDIITVILFPIIGRMLGLSDTGYGLWIGTAVNDTSSVVAAGYAFSDAAGALATIVKLTRTLFIVPVVLVFSWINAKKKAQSAYATTINKVKVMEIFPWFILLFLVVVGIKSTGIIPEVAVGSISNISKLFLAMALASIGMKTSLKEVAGVGITPMIAGVIIDTSVVIVALFAQGIILGA
ncbi:YeiH family protein [Anaerosphaera multitolerans]|uniref:Putative sulfate exporter family transporter n=1 Tax=Anaerosphaera multitolerans TaxID=2487351 RepID=A0A437S684_9FIRM|nr:putative sulfate exporter family transporter [Anaerosphaera multitolerans]RVU54487.1 putative sulfate exporter family transporter [Anaerosphaera multitolerans]